MIDLLLNPFLTVLLLLLALLWLLARHRRRVGRPSLILCAATLLVLWATTSRGVSTALLETLERGQQPLEPVAVAPPDAILVLGGGIRDRTTPRPVLGETTLQRLQEGLRLAAQWPEVPLVFSGGDRSGQGQATGELMAEAAVSAGVAADRIFVDPLATNTRENALNLLEMARQRGWRRLVLVTSASHMPRALGAFRSLGADPIPAPCDFTGVGRPVLSLLLPSLEAPPRIHAFLHEIVGQLWYRLHGWA